MKNMNFKMWKKNNFKQSNLKSVHKYFHFQNYITNNVHNTYIV